MDNVYGWDYDILLKFYLQVTDFRFTVCDSLKQLKRSRRRLSAGLRVVGDLLKQLKQSRRRLSAGLRVVVVSIPRSPGQWASRAEVGQV